MQIITFDGADRLLDWTALRHALEAGHNRPKATLGDQFLYRGSDTLLSRAAWIDGMGVAVKSATVLPGNPDAGRPMINGGMLMFNDKTGQMEALVDFHLVTKWKTAGDSLLAASHLARKDSRNILIVGAGTVGRSLVQAYASLFPDARFQVWNRTASKARNFAASLADAANISVAEDLQKAVEAADIITCATMSTNPVIQGAWLRPGQHLDLIGAYRPDMRETDDTALTRARVFVDSYDTTCDHIGELKIPLAAGVISRADIVADYYGLADGSFARKSDDDITLFKNGGGGHLDLMTGRYILEAWNARND